MRRTRAASMPSILPGAHHPRRQVRGCGDARSAARCGQCSLKCGQDLEWGGKLSLTGCKAWSAMCDLQSDASDVRRVLDDLADAVVATDGVTQVRIWSRRAEALFGWSEADALGRTLLDLGLAPDEPEALQLTERTLLGHRWEGTYAVVTKSGDTIYVRFRATPLRRDDGTVAGIVLLCRDSLRPTGQHERAAGRISLLADAGTALGRSLDVGRTLSDIAELFVPSFADHCIIDLYDARGVLRRLVSVNTPGFNDPDAWIADGQPVSYPPGHMCAEAMASMRPVLRRVSEDDVVEIAGDERIAAIYRRVGVRSVIAMPLPRSEQVRELIEDHRGISGVVTLMRSLREESYETEDADLIAAITHRAGLALDNAWLYDHQLSTVKTLQTNLLPRQPHTGDGVTVAGAYRPGARSQVGGDFYDVMELSSGRYGLVIGDVQGRGAEAAVVMGQLRASLRAYALQDLQPSQMLSYLDTIVQEQGEELIVTCMFAVFDPFLRVCTIANAGHPPPILVRAGSRSKPVGMVEANLPLGIASMGGSPFVETVLPIEPGSSLLFYTDGVVERRDMHWDAAIERAVIQLDRISASAADDLAWALMDAIPGDAGDDAAVLAVQAAEADLPHAAYQLPPQADAVAQARDRTRTTLAAWNLAQEADLAELVVSELVTNALRHAVPNHRGSEGALTGGLAGDGEATNAEPNGHIPLGLRRGSTSLWIEVGDFDVRLPRRADPGRTDEAGRGLMLVDALSHRWGARPTADGKVVWVELRPRPLPG